MTNDATNFMPLAGFGGFDYLTAGTQPSEKGVAPAQRNTCRLWNQPGDPPWLGRGELVINDFSQQGLNHPEGDFSTNSNGYAWATLATNMTNELVPSPILISFTDASIAGNKPGFHTCAAFGTVFMGIGSAANHSLFKETSTTDPTPVAITYSPAAEICGMARTLATGAERLAVGHVGQPVKFFSDAAGTVSATGDASTNSCWDIIMSGVNANAAKPGTPQLLLYCGTTIGYISSDVAMTTAVTVSHTGVNAGGWAVGAIKAQGRAQMAYWGIPQVTNTSGVLASGAYCDIYATPMDGGTDFLPIQLKYLPNGVKKAIPFRDGILAHDGEHVVYWDGNNEYDLSIFKKRVSEQVSRTATGPTINHDVVFSVCGLIVRGADCGALVAAVPGDGATNAQVFGEMYNFETGSWHNIAFPQDAGALTKPILCSGSAMSSTGNRFWWHGSDGVKIYGFFVARPGESLLWQWSIGSGSTSNTAMPQFGAGGEYLLGPRWRIDQDPPGVVIGTRSIARSPKVIYEAEFSGNLDYGGAANYTFNITVYGYSMDGTTRSIAFNQTFSQGMPSSHYIRKNPATAWTNIQDIQLFLTATNTTNPTRRSVQLVPFVVRFAYIKDMTWKEGGVTMYPPTAITAENAPMLLGVQGQA